MSDSAQVLDVHDDRLMAIQPPWFVEWGNTIILFLLLLIGIAASVVRYPDIMRAPVLVNATARATDVVAITGGRVTILVREGDDVATGAALAVIDSPVRFEDVRTVKAAAQNVDRFVPAAVGSLGELEQSYARLLGAHAEWTRTADPAYESRKLEELRAQIADQTEVQRSQESQVTLLASEVESYRADHRRLAKLHAQNLLSDADLGAARARVAVAEQRLESARGAAVTGRMRIAEAEQLLADRTRQFGIDRTRARLELDESRRALLAAIGAWEQRYVLVAPTAGRVSFHAAWSSGQIVKPADPLFTVVPREHAVSARAFLPRAGAAKVRSGQHAIVKLDDYPFHEYGGVRAIVTSIAPVARNDRYAITLSFPDGLRTTIGRSLEGQAELRGSVEITTENRALFSRMFDRFRAITTTEASS